MIRIINCAIVILFLTVACRKEQEVEVPVIEVSASSQTITAGGTIRFQIDGAADFVTFYSGEPLSDYSYKDGRVIDAGKVTLSFDSYTFSGTQQDQLQVVLSTDFDGVYAIDNIRAAEWVNITDRYTLTSLENEWEPAGSAEITDNIEPGRPFYIAYKYISKPRSEAGVGKIWKVRNLFLTSETEIGNTQLANLVDAGWQLVYDENGVVDITRNFVVSTALSFRSNAAPNDEVHHDVWIISKAFSVDDMDMGPDRATPVKSFTEPWLSVYDRTYSTPGEYTATFVAFNDGIYGRKETVKHIKITVEPKN